MTVRKIFLLSLAIFLGMQINAQNKHGKNAKFLSYKGLVMAGYQGWFRAPGDGSGSDWGHYGKKRKI